MTATSFSHSVTTTSLHCVMTRWKLRRRHLALTRLFPFSICCCFSRPHVRVDVCLRVCCRKAFVFSDLFCSRSCFFFYLALWYDCFAKHHRPFCAFFPLFLCLPHFFVNLVCVPLLYYLFPVFFFFFEKKKNTPTMNLLLTSPKHLHALYIPHVTVKHLVRDCVLH